MGEWSSCVLGDLLSLEYGSALGAEERTGEGYPVFGSNGVVGHHAMPLVSGPGIVVGRKGSAGALTWSESDFWPIDTTYWVKPKTALELRWVYDALRRCGLERLHSSTGVPGLNRDDAYERRVPVPPLEEQRRIAEILDTIDETIQATERVIAKLQETRLGLLAATVWSAHDGEELPLGALADGGPRGMAIGPFGSDLTVDDYRESGVPVFFVRDVRANEPLAHRSTVYVSPQKASALSAHHVRKGDIVITKMGLPPGIAAVHSGSVPMGVVTADLIRLRPDESCVEATWLALAINGPSMKRQVDAITAGVTRPKITLRDFRLMTVAVPALQVQFAHVERVRALDDLIRTEQQGIVKLHQTRQGLAGDLLSGRVRTVAA